MTRHRLRVRPAFTLIELLVVCTIIAILATLALAIYPRISPAQRTAQGASQVQGWLLIAKQRAYRDRVPRGVKLLQDPDGLIRRLVYIEQPDDFTAGAPNNTPKDSTLVKFTLPTGVDFTNSCAKDDYLVLGDAHDPANFYRILAVTADELTIYPKLTSNVFSTFPYRIIRRPRQVDGEEDLKLPVDVVIDPDPFASVASSYSPPDSRPRPTLPWPYLTIVFLPNGGVMQEPLPSGATVPAGYVYPAGKYILYVRDPSLGPYEGEPTLITVYARTGAIAAHPVNQSDILNPWLFTQDGRSSGM